MGRSGATLPRRVPWRTRVRTSGRWCGNRVFPSSPWSLLKRCFGFILIASHFFYFLFLITTLTDLFLCHPLPPGARPREELPVLAQTWLTTQHCDVRSLQDHNAVPHRVRLLRHHRAKDQTPPDGPREDSLAPAVHRLAWPRLSWWPQRLPQWVESVYPFMVILLLWSDIYHPLDHSGSKIKAAGEDDLLEVFTVSKLSYSFIVYLKMKSQASVLTFFPQPT